MNFRMYSAALIACMALGNSTALAFDLNSAADNLSKSGDAALAGANKAKDDAVKKKADAEAAAKAKKDAADKKIAQEKAAAQQKADKEKASAKDKIDKTKTAVQQKIDQGTAPAAKKLNEEKGKAQEKIKAGQASLENTKNAAITRTVASVAQANPGTVRIFKRDCHFFDGPYRGAKSLGVKTMGTSVGNSQEGKSWIEFKNTDGHTGYAAKNCF